jgi:hypothetical protein
MSISDAQRELLVQRLQVKLAASRIQQPKAKAPEPGLFGRSPMGTREALGKVWARRGHLAAGVAEKAPLAVLGAGSTIGLEALRRKFFNKPPTVMQEILGRGGIGRRAVGLGILAAGLGAGAAGVSKTIDYTSDHFGKKRAFEAMLKQSPALKEHKPQELQAAFNTLHKFNPDMAEDPLTAASFMRRAMMFKEEGIQPADVLTIANARKLRAEALDKKNEYGALRSAFTSSMGQLPSSWQGG